MKQYIYQPEECGLSKWPDGTLRLEGFEVVESPTAADVFVYPGAIHKLTGADLRKLPNFANHEARHVFFHCADDDPQRPEYYDVESIIIRCNTRDWMIRRAPNTISWPWPVEDFKECVDSRGGFSYDVSFHGWRSSAVRRASVDSIGNGLCKADVMQYPDFCGYIYDTPEGLRRRQLFRRSMKDSRVALCPESIPGVFPYRFFEAMSAGRVPMLVGSNYVLPWADVIPWSEFALFLPSDRAADAGQVVREFCHSHKDSQIVEKGLLARKYWDRYIDREKAPALMAEAVERKLAA